MRMTRVINNGSIVQPSQACLYTHTVYIPYAISRSYRRLDTADMSVSMHSSRHLCLWSWSHHFNCMHKVICQRLEWNSMACLRFVNTHLHRPYVECVMYIANSKEYFIFFQNYKYSSWFYNLLRLPSMHMLIYNIHIGIIRISQGIRIICTKNMFPTIE